MPPNFNEYPKPSPVNFADSAKENGTTGPASSSSDNTILKVVRSLTTLAAHMMIGIVTGVSILFAARNITTAVNQHILLCVLGYQFLMAEAMLSLAPDSWLTTINLKHRRWVHSVMQVVGSALALAGSFVMIRVKATNWDSLHGQFALVAMVFTTVSLVNGVASLYAYELRRILPGILSRLTHICFGIVALATASISLAYGFDKGSFRNWVGIAQPMDDVLIVMTAVMTTFVIINPFITFFVKAKSRFSN